MKSTSWIEPPMFRPDFDVFDKVVPKVRNLLIVGLFLLISPIIIRLNIAAKTKQVMAAQRVKSAKTQ
jgi:hypothetical protein